MPAYAPDYQVQTGLLYRWKNQFKASFIGTVVDNSFATDTRAICATNTSVMTSLWS